MNTALTNVSHTSSTELTFSQALDAFQTSSGWCVESMHHIGYPRDATAAHEIVSIERDGEDGLTICVKRNPAVEFMKSNADTRLTGIVECVRQVGPGRIEFTFTDLAEHDLLDAKHGIGYWRKLEDDSVGLVLVWLHEK
jgi:hypothetical protein